MHRPPHANCQDRRNFSQTPKQFVVFFRCWCYSTVLISFIWYTDFNRVRQYTLNKRHNEYEDDIYCGVVSRYGNTARLTSIVEVALFWVFCLNTIRLWCAIQHKTFTFFFWLSLSQFRVECTKKNQTTFNSVNGIWTRRCIKIVTQEVESLFYVNQHNKHKTHKATPTNNCCDWTIARFDSKPLLFVCPTKSFNVQHTVRTVFFL